MKVYIASDHAGFELKAELIKEFANGYEFIDLGTNTSDSVDYPDYAQELAKKVLNDDSLGILICGSGVGMSISANRFKGIRAALVTNVEIAKLSKQHNNSNVLVLGSRFLTKTEAINITKAWFETEFEAGRHLKRIEKIEL